MLGQKIPNLHILMQKFFLSCIFFSLNSICTTILHFTFYFPFYILNLLYAICRLRNWNKSNKILFTVESKDRTIYICLKYKDNHICKKR